MTTGVAAIEIVDHGTTVNAYEDAPRRRVLAVLMRPRPYSGGPYVVTVPRTGEKVERSNYGLARAALHRLAFIEWKAIKKEEA